MNIATSETSLYQLTQDLEQPLVSISIGAETLKSYINSIVDLLIEKQIQATVWVKLPETKSWVNQIQKLQLEGNTNQIYLCSSKKHLVDSTYLNQDLASTPVIPVKLVKSSTLQRESFLIILSTDFCGLVLSQWQKSQITIGASGKRLQQPYLEMVSSFNDQVIRAVLTEIGNNITPENNALENNFKNNLTVETDFSADWATTDHAHLLNDLLLRQLNNSEVVQNRLDSLSQASHVPDNSSTILGLQEDFLNNLVQELRSPITHMKTALSLLESKQIKGEQRQRYLQMVSNECDRQNSLVGGLLELLQLDTPAEAEYLHLDDIVPGIVSTYQPLAEEKSLSLGYTIPANLPPISCPRTWFRQIVINLLNNSLQFTPANGRVFVQAAFKNDQENVEISVTDTGVGIASKEINKIFDGFYRTKSSTDEKITGAGLGLTLVQQLIQRCGGSISVTSKVDKGTTFKILMPAVPLELL